MSKKLFSGMRIVDGSGNVPAKNAQMLVEDGLIRKIDNIVPNDIINARVSDLTGKTIIPGLIDCHVHHIFDATPHCLQNAAPRSDVENTIEAVSNLKKLLSDGVIFFRDMSADRHIDIAIRDAVVKGKLTGPDFLACGGIISMTGGHCHMIAREADGVGEIVKAVREHVKIGADFIKFMATGGIHTPGNKLETAQLTFEELSAGVNEAHRLGRKTAAHALTPAGIKNAVEGGVDSLEHGASLDERIIEIMLRQGTYLVPTLYAVKIIAGAGESDGFTRQMLDKAKTCAEWHEKSFRLALASGVKIAFGTDRGTSFNYHESGSREMVLMAEYGMEPMDIIVSATKTASELLEIDGLYGTLEAGKYANFIVFDNNPLDDAHFFTSPKIVYIKGEPVLTA